jgi:hypothetical protein
VRETGAWRVRGVVHTPSEVARWVARAADRALQGIGRPGGLADPAVVVVDPACGPGAFLAAAVALGAGRPSRPRAVHGLDVDADAVRTAEGVLGPTFTDAGWPLELRGCDTLAGVHDFGAGATIAVIGNPPWAGRSENRGAPEMERLLEDFRRDGEGVRLPERKLGVLSDDYVRFWRWACEVVARADGGGVVAFVTNASFVDGPVHRGMRDALCRWFDRIDVLDLGGNALTASDDGGIRDENVFGVRPGVVATVASRAAATRTRRAEVRHGRVRGRRTDKLRVLEAGGPDLVPIVARGPAFVLRPPRGEIPDHYLAWPSLDEAMPFHREGVQTNRDAIATDVDRDRLLARLRDFVRGRRTAELARAWRPTRHYDPEVARAALAEALERRGETDVIRRMAYRPFEDRWLVAVAPLCHRPRPALLAAIGHGGPVLLGVRKDRGERRWAHFGVTDLPPDSSWLSSRSSCRTRAYPAYTPSGAPNLDPRIHHDLTARLGTAPTPADFILYALAFVASPDYQRRFDAALRLSYPRIPPPDDLDGFRRLVEHGRCIARGFATGGRRSTVRGAGPGTVVVGHARFEAPALEAAIEAARADVSRRLD